MSDSSVSSPDAPPPLRAGYGNPPPWVPQQQQHAMQHAHCHSCRSSTCFVELKQLREAEHSQETPHDLLHGGMRAEPCFLYPVIELCTLVRLREREAVM